MSNPGYVPQLPSWGLDQIIATANDLLQKYRTVNVAVDEMAVKLSHTLAEEMTITPPEGSDAYDEILAGMVAAFGMGYYAAHVVAALRAKPPTLH